MEHLYSLEPYKGISSRYTCPDCKQPRQFAKYITISTGEYVAWNVGRCNRESNCSYHYTPRQYFQDNHINNKQTHHTEQPPIKKQEPLPYSYISINDFKNSLKGYTSNNFVKYLTGLFNNKIAEKVISRYFIGSSKKRFKSKDYPNYESEPGATIFWQIDTKGRVRTGKIMLYSSITGKRIKQPFNHISWVHKAFKEPQFNLKQCLFGEHLLRSEPHKPVAMVESEKTAIIGSVYFPEFIWLAAGSLNNLNKQKCRVLAGRNVTIFPDLNGYEKWKAKAKELAGIATIGVSDLLEKKATPAERQQGLDLADYLIRFDYRQFITVPVSEPEVLNIVENLTKPDISEIPSQMLKNVNKIRLTNNFNSNYKPSENWQAEIETLEQFFLQHPTLTGTIQLSPGNRITDLPLFIDSHLNIVKANNGNKTFLPYLGRLQELQKQLTFN